MGESFATMRGFVLLLALGALLAAARCPNSCSGHGSCVAHHCQCDSGFMGVDCSVEDVVLVPARNGSVTVRDTAAPRKWLYYHYTLDEGQTANFSMHETNTGILHDCDIYVQSNRFPTKRNYYDKDTHGIGDDATVFLDDTVVRGVWYVGVYGFLGCDFELTLTVGSGCDCSGHGTCDLGGNCQCAPGWGGSDCSATNRTLVPGTPLTGHVGHREWDYFYIDLTEPREQLLFSMDSINDCDIYVRKDEFPTLFRFYAVNASVPATGQHDMSTVLLEEPDAGRWYVGIYGFKESDYTVSVDMEAFSGNTCPNNCSYHGSCANGRCNCSPVFGGQACEFHMNDLILTQSMDGYVDAGEWNYFSVSTNTANNVVVQAFQNATMTPNGDCDLYIKSGSYPNRTTFDYADLGFGPTMRIQIDSPGRDHFYIGVYGWTRCAFNITVNEESVAQDCHNGHIGPTGSCVCSEGYYGSECEDHAEPLDQGAPPQESSVATGSWKYYSFSANASSFLFTLRETNGSGGNIWTYLSEDTAPQQNDYLVKNDDEGFMHVIHHKERGAPQMRNYVFGVFGSPFGGEGVSTSYRLSAFAF